MSKPRESFGKKEVRNKKEKKRKDKEKKRIERKENPDSNSFDDMIAYVDEFGNISSTPPDPTKKRKEVDKDSIVISITRQEAVDPDAPRIGTVTFFNEAKGYGFIKDSQNGQSVFMHVNNVLESVKEGNLVSYKTEKGQKGIAAIYVRLHKEVKNDIKPEVQDSATEPLDETDKEE